MPVFPELQQIGAGVADQGNSVLAALLGCGNEGIPGAEIFAPHVGMMDQQAQRQRFGVVCMAALASPIPVQIGIQRVEQGRRRRMVEGMRRIDDRPGNRFFARDIQYPATQVGQQRCVIVGGAIRPVASDVGMPCQRHITLQTGLRIDHDQSCSLC